MADWRIEEAAGTIVGSNDVPEFIDEVLAGLGPLVFDAFTVTPWGDTGFAFADGRRLTVFAGALPSDDSEAWILTRPDGSTVSGGPGTRWALEGAS